MLTYTMLQKNQTTVVNFAGPADENAAKVLSELLARLPQTPICLNMGGIEYFNSLGVRAWLNFVKLMGDGRPFSYSQCTPDFINQINMIPALTKGAEILSFSSEFACPRCGHQQTIEFNGKNDKSTLLGEFSQQTCDKCGDTLLPEEDPETVLAFKDHV